MANTRDLADLKVFGPKKSKHARKKDASEEEGRLSKLGHINMPVFSSDGMYVLGYLVRRPDIAGMVKQSDIFVALDSFELSEDGKSITITRPDDGVDDAARKRLGIDWDSCIMWVGMDAKTADGTVLGEISGAEYDEKTGRVQCFLATTGSISKALIGSYEITPELYGGYRKGCMVVNAESADLEPNGGLAQAAGEGYAKAKAKGAEAGKKASVAAAEAGKKAGEVGKKAGAAVSEAVDEGSYTFGKMIGDTKRAYQAAVAGEDEPELDSGSQKKTKAANQPPAVEALDVQVSAPVEALPASQDERASAAEPVTYAPVADQPAVAAATASAAGSSASAAKSSTTAKKTTSTSASSSATKKTTTTSSSSTAKKTSSSSASTAKKSSSSSNDEELTAGDKAARAVGKQIGAFGKMFTDFYDEYKKASQ